ncbi:MAG: LysE family translocator [Pseudomonadota bacterium]
MDLNLFIAFTIAAGTFAFIPGPSIVYMMGRTLASGRRAGLEAAGGVHLGGYVHVVAAALGLSALFEYVPWAFAALKLAGAAYVIWIGIQLIRRPTDLTTVKAPSKSLSLRQSLLVEVLNPTTALFFIAFLPQFASPEAALPLWAQFMVLGIVTNILFSLSDIPYVLAAGTLRDRVTSSKLATRLQRGGGAILIGLGLNLALSRSTA